MFEKVIKNTTDKSTKMEIVNYEVGKVKYDDLSKMTAKVTITLKKSLSGRIQNQKDCAAALGLKKVGDVTVQPDNAATMGKVAKISHLVEITK